MHVAQVFDMLREAGIEVRTFSADDLLVPRLTPWRYINNSAARRGLRRTLNDFQPDVVHLHNFYHLLSPGILAELRDWRRTHQGRIVMTAHDYHLACPNSGGRFLINGRMVPADPARLDALGYLLSRRWDHRSQAHGALKLVQHLWSYRVRRLHRIIDVVICPSRFMERLIERTGIATAHVPHPVHLGDEQCGVRDRSSGCLRMIFAGRIEPEKGLAEFLELLPEGFAGDLTMIGQGSEMARCREIVQRRGLADRVLFTGRLSHDEAMASIAAAHVLVLPSLWWENCPLVLLEALAVGTSILVSSLGAMPELVQEAHTGFTFVPGDRASLESALQAIIAAHAAGSLNQFNVSSLLHERSADRYAKRLLEAYGQRPAFESLQPVGGSMAALDMETIRPCP